MTTDFRALCAELVNRFDELYGRICDDDTIIYVDSEVNELMNYARAALAEAVPEGREPASVIEQPTVMQLIELSDEIEAAGLGQIDFARAVLARWGNPAPHPPIYGKVAELAGKLVEAANGTAAMSWDQHVQHILRAAELLQSLSPPQPVPVSERWPGPGDCLDEGWAWFFYPRIGWRQAVPPVTAAYTHWLPAHAIPLPTAND